MIMSGQMQHAVKDQDFQFVCRGVSHAARVLSGDLRRDGKVAGKVCQ